MMCPTTSGNTKLDLCRGGAYTSMFLPSFGASSHNSVFLLPVYKPLLRQLEQKKKTVKVWNEESISILQASVECTDCGCFTDLCGDINKLNDTVSSYVTFCVDSAI